MQSTPRVHPAATIVVLLACPLLSALALGGIAIGLAAAVGSHQSLSIGGVIAAAVFVVNAVALCMALSRGEDDARVAVAAADEIVAETAVHARAS